MDSFVLPVDSFHYNEFPYVVAMNPGAVEAPGHPNFVVYEVMISEQDYTLFVKYVSSKLSLKSVMSRRHFVSIFIWRLETTC